MRRSMVSFMGGLKNEIARPLKAKPFAGGA
jgi:hypothetical protein